MTKIILLVTILIGALPSHAQTYHPFKFDLGFGKPLQYRPGNALFYMEPNWNFPMYKVGVRMEVAEMYAENQLSVLATLDHYLRPKKRSFRPFIGCGIGQYRVNENWAYSSGPPATQTAHATKALGGMLRAGFEFHLLRVSAEYNVVQDTYVRNYTNNVLLSTQTYTNSYFCIKAGINIRRRTDRLPPRMPWEPKRSN